VHALPADAEHLGDLGDADKVEHERTLREAVTATRLLLTIVNAKEYAVDRNNSWAEHHHQ